MRQIKIIIERRSNRFVAYPLGVRGGKTSDGTTYEEALARLRLSTGVLADSVSASLVAMRPPVLEACVAEAGDRSGFPAYRRRKVRVRECRFAASSRSLTISSKGVRGIFD